MQTTTGTVVAVSVSPTHTFSKPVQEAITLVEGLGVEGDAHLGVTVKHRSRVKADPTQPNLRQVHLIHAELFDEVRGKGYAVKPGEMGENITTRGVALLALLEGLCAALAARSPRRPGDLPALMDALARHHLDDGR